MLPGACAGCVFWESGQRLERRCGDACDPVRLGAWYDQVTQEWGECGRVAYEDDDLLGFIKYAPSRYFPQARTFDARPLDQDVPLIACMHISPHARHRGLGSVLLRAALKDLSMRGERRVEAFGAAKRPAALDESPFIGVDFLLRNGFTVSRPDPSFPLLKLDVRALVTWSENLEAVLETLRFPARKLPRRVPAGWTTKGVL